VKEARWNGGLGGFLPSPENAKDGEEDAEGMGKNDGTVRFLWDHQVVGI
jgi:hypothetical protein